jgi:hypothetical protein
MSVLIFRLNGVGEDEAQEVRDIFTEHAIEYYETDAGRWGLSVAALWLIDKQQLALSKQLLADYQQQRLQRLDSASDEEKALNRPLTVAERFRQSPLQFLLLIATIVAIVGLSTLPFISIY